MAKNVAGAIFAVCCGVGLAAACSAATPRSDLPGSSSASAAATALPSAKASASTAPKAVLPKPPKPYRYAWSSKPLGRLRALMLTPWGDLLAVGSGRVRLLSRKDGSELEATDVCKSSVAAGFVSDRRALLVCNKTLEEIRFGPLRVRTVHELKAKWDARDGVISPASVAVRFTFDRVEVLRVGSWNKLFDQELNRVSLALSHDGRLLEAANREKRRVFDLDTSKEVSAPSDELPRVKWLTNDTSTKWISSELSVVAEHNTLSLASTELGSRQPLKLPQGGDDIDKLEVSASGNWICAADDKGLVSCFSRVRPKASGYKAGDDPPRLSFFASAARADDPCASSAACVSLGHCRSDKEGRCGAAGDADCAGSTVCRKLEQCSAAGGTCVATASGCAGSELCTKTKLCALQDGACAVDDNGCREQPACRQKGKCSAVEAICSVGGDDDCWQSEGCVREGSCSADKGVCAPLSDEDCRQSIECVGGHGIRARGKCSVKDGECQLANNFGCQQKFGCTRSGSCTYQNNGCVVASDADCRRSSGCKKWANCSFVGGNCTTTKDADCRDSELCSDEGRCGYNGRKCVASSKAQCRKSKECTTQGACVLGNVDDFTGGGRGHYCLVLDHADCAPTKDCTDKGHCKAGLMSCAENCKKSFGCLFYGLCHDNGKRCVATAASCRRSAACRKKRLRRCRAKGGRCVR